MSRLLAIDPGTYAMGLALFDGPNLVGSRLLTPSKKWPAQKRAIWLTVELAKVLEAYTVHAVAMERPGGKPGHLPPTLLALCIYIRQMAKEKRLPLAEYPPATVTKAVAPRGWPGDRKAKLRAGVVALYGPILQTASQDVVDAIAVGHCHLAKLQEKELVGL